MEVVEKNNKTALPFPAIIAVLALLSYGNIWFFRDVVWDDNCWLQSLYSSINLNDFLQTGFVELRRVPLGIFLYYFFKLHKTTDYFYEIWHTVNMITQIGTPVFLYLFIKNMFKNCSIPAFFIGISYTVLPLDYTLPYATVTSYRLSIMLGVLSFYLTEKAFIDEKPRWSLILTALLVSGISYYVFLEGTIIFEPARLFVIWYILNKRNGVQQGVMKKAFVYWMPFFILCIPLGVYKLMFKPYGIYAGTYTTDPLFILNWKLNAKTIAYLMHVQWIQFAQKIGYAKISSFFTGLLGTIFSIYFTKNSILQQHEPSGGSWKNIWQTVRPIFILGMLLFIPAILLLNFVGSYLGRAMNSSHATIVQFGYAVVTGVVLYLFYAVSTGSHLKNKIYRAIIVCIFGLGVFFNNLNLDLYFNAWKEQNKFWQAFEKRFPALPEKAKFMIDAKDRAGQLYTDLDNYYKLEFALNLLYARSDNPSDFRRYSVYTPDKLQEHFNQETATVERLTHFGKETADTRDMIIVKYKDGEIFINREIIKKYPDISYKKWADKELPELPRPVIYPLRQKLKGFIK